jgi:hypothetical protein
MYAYVFIYVLIYYNLAPLIGKRSAYTILVWKPFAKKFLGRARNM